jgi:hypothetical protein
MHAMTVLKLEILNSMQDRQGGHVWHDAVGLRGQ